MLTQNQSLFMGLMAARHPMSFGRGTTPSRPEDEPGMTGGWGSYPVWGWIKLPQGVTPETRGVTLNKRPIPLDKLPVKKDRAGRDVAAPSGAYMGSDGYIYGDFGAGWALLASPTNCHEVVQEGGGATYMECDPYVSGHEEVGPVGPGGKATKPTRPSYGKDLAIGSIAIVGVLGGGAGYMLTKGKMNPLAGATIGGGLAVLALMAFRPGGWLRQG